MITIRGRRRARPGRWVAVLACGVFALSAYGQTPAPDANAPAMPKPNCGERPEHPGHLASDAQKRQWGKDANTYLECLKKFATEQRAIAQHYMEAANALIDRYNSTVKEMQAEAQAAAE
jgi:hypothetical protein